MKVTLSVVNDDPAAALLEAGKMGHWRRRRRDGSLRKLTGAEILVARLVVEGWGRADIATRLGVSPKTYDTHMLHIKAKLGVENPVQLARLAWANGWALGVQETEVEPVPDDQDDQAVVERNATWQACEESTPKSDKSVRTTPRWRG